MPQIYVFYQDNTDGANNNSETGYDNAFHYQDWSGSGNYVEEYTSPTWSRTGYHTYWYLDRAEVYSYYYKGHPENRNGWWFLKTVKRDASGETLPNGTYPSGGKIKYNTWNAEQWNYFMVKSSAGITFYIEFSWHGGSERQNGKTFGNPYQLLGVKTAPAGYTHTGWYNDLMGHKSLSANVVFNFYAGDVAISATYTANTYTLAYKNAGTSTGGTAAGNVSYKGSYTLPKASPPTGYTFSSWSSTQGTTTTNGDNYTWNTAGDLTWTAKYTINSYTATFNANGKGTGTTKTQDYDTSVSLPTLKAVGYTFGGWATTNTATTADVTAAFNMPVGGRTLYAIWTENTGKKVSFSELQAVFGGSHPISMSEYRAQSGQTTANSIITLSTHLKGKGPAPP
jgi:uncharacterized repeat protein (TIGR02543 family)